MPDAYGFLTGPFPDIEDPLNSFTSFGYRKMLNLISSHEALFALQAGPCRVAREGWPWGKWLESEWGNIPVHDSGAVPRGLQLNIKMYENDKPTDKLWEPEFADHALNDWYILEERPKQEPKV